MRRIYVFGSNRPGRHGKGTALIARQKHGAIYGQGEGLQGNSYALPTRDANPIGSAYPGVRSLSLNEIEKSVQRFIEFARNHPDWIFDLQPVGCCNAGFKPSQIAPMFADAPPNVIMPEIFLINS